MHLEIRDSNGEWIPINTGALLTIIMTMGMFLISIKLMMGVQ